MPQSRFEHVRFKRAFGRRLCCLYMSDYQISKLSPLLGLCRFRRRGLYIRCLFTLVLRVRLASVCCRIFKYAVDLRTYQDGRSRRVKPHQQHDDRSKRSVRHAISIEEVQCGPHPIPSSPLFETNTFFHVALRLCWHTHAIASHPCATHAVNSSRLSKVLVGFTQPLLPRGQISWASLSAGTCCSSSLLQFGQQTFPRVKTPFAQSPVNKTPANNFSKRIFSSPHRRLPPSLRVKSLHFPPFVLQTTLGLGRVGVGS
jgi:hypothetical protein